MFQMIGLTLQIIIVETEKPKSIEANRPAIEFIQSINFKQLSKTIFKDNLAILASRDGSTIGELSISVEGTRKFSFFFTPVTCQL